MKTETHTTEQLAALAAFEAACESSDLYAFGHGRRDRAWNDLAACYDDVHAAGVADALTDREHTQGADAVSRRGFQR